MRKVRKFADNSETLKEARINVRDISLVKEIGLFILLFMLMMLVYILTANILLGMIKPSDMDSTYLTFILFIIMPVIVYFYVTGIEKRSWRSVGFSGGNAISETLKGLLIGFVMFLAVVVIGLLLGQFRFIGFDFSRAIYLVPFVVGFFIQSFSEEIYTRGWTITYFSKRHSIFTAILVSNIMFVLPHMSNNGIDLLSVFNIFLCGCVFAVMFLRFDNIWVCGGAHTAWNVSQGVIFGFDVSGIATPSLLKFSQVGENIVNGGAFGPESGLIVTFVVVLTLVLFVYCSSVK